MSSADHGLSPVGSLPFAVDNTHLFPIITHKRHGTILERLTHLSKTLILMYSVGSYRTRNLNSLVQVQTNYYKIGQLIIVNTTL